MSDNQSKFNDKVRIASSRMQSWDYGENASYHVVICTENRLPFFGEILDEKMHFNNNGCIVEKFWLDIPLHFTYVKLDEFVVMPNHIHGIITIEKPKPERSRQVETPKLGVFTSWRPGILGVIISQYKRYCTINIRKIEPKFEWQSQFYKHIIRDRQDLLNTVDYIRENPKKWQEDEYFKV